MSDEHVAYKANLQQPAPNLGPLRFSDGVFLADREWPDFTCLLGLEVIKLEFILRLRVRKQPIIALYFESETVLSFITSRLGTC